MEECWLAQAEDNQDEVDANCIMEEVQDQNFDDGVYLMEEQSHPKF